MIFSSQMKADEKPTSEGRPAWLNVVSDQVGSMRFGMVQIIVHENRVVQIERTEKVRFDKPEPSSSLDTQRPK
jgi:hypothetical protein